MNEAYLELAPTRCVTREKNCEVSLSVSWHVLDHNEICIRITGNYQRVICHLPNLINDYTIIVESQRNVFIEVLSADMNDVLTEAELFVYHVKHRPSRRKVAWSIF